MGGAAIGWVWLVVVAASPTPTDAGTPFPTLAEAIADADVIVWGQVEQVQNQGSWAVATLRIEQTFKGRVSGSVRLHGRTAIVSPNDSGVELQSLSIGTRGLYFLRKSRIAAQPWEVSLGGAGFLEGYRSSNTPKVRSNAAIASVQLPAEVCEPADYGYCPTTLAQVLHQGRLGAYRPPARGAALYRVISTTCDPCSVESIAALPPDAGFTACESALLGEWDPQAAQCAQGAMQSARAFRLRMPVEGIDSSVEWLFVSDGKNLWQYSGDSSVNGGGRCAGVVSRVSCRSIVIDARADESWIKCEEAGEREWLCSQSSTSRQTLGPAHPTSELHCDSLELDDCVAPGGRLSSHDIAAPFGGPDLICDNGFLGRLVCRPR